MLLVLLLAIPIFGSARALEPAKQWSCNSRTSSGLAALAEQANNRYFGTAWQSFYLASKRFGGILNSQFDQYTPENEMKWGVIEPIRGVFNWTGSDLIIQRAKAQSSVVRGHNFCWDQQTPEYVTSITGPTLLQAVLKEHIDAVLGRYGNDLYAFDVINEPLNEDGTIKPSVWYNVLGEDYLGIALDLAHAAAPNVRLYINDYNIEGVNPKSIAMAALAKNLLDQGHALHGIGFESHFIGGQVPSDIAQSMKMFTDMGLDVAITELDVRVPVDNQGIANATWLQIQAEDYAGVVKTCLGNDHCPGVTVWGFGDAHSWIPSAFAGYGAADLYGTNYQPKPAYAAVLNAL